MAVTIGVRLASNVLLFALLARLWGGDRFGLFMYPYVLASIGSVAVDYGLSLRVVREIAADRSCAPALLPVALWIKLVLAAVVLTAAAVVLHDGGSFGEEAVLVLTLLGAASIQSFAQVMLCGLRGLGRFDFEARVGVFGALLHVGVAGAMAMAGATPMAVALGMIATRCAMFVFASLTLAAVLPQVQFSKVRAADVAQELSIGLPFAAHALLGTLYFQIDTVFIRHLLGFESVGWYQAGMRVVLGGLLVSEVLGNVYLVTLAKAVGDLGEFRAVARRMSRHFTLTGILGGVCLVVFAGPISRVLYGPEYGAVIDILPVLGCMMLVRYLILPYAICLTACGAQRSRATGAGIAVVVSIVTNSLLIPSYGLFGAVVAAGITHIVLGTFFAWSLARQPNAFVPDLRTVVLGLLSLVLVATVASAPTSPFVLPVALLAVLGALTIGIEKGERAAFTQKLRTISLGARV